MPGAVDLGGAPHDGGKVTNMKPRIWLVEMGMTRTGRAEEGSIGAPAWVWYQKQASCWRECCSLADRRVDMAEDDIHILVRQKRTVPQGRNNRNSRGTVQFRFP